MNTNKFKLILLLFVGMGGSFFSCKDYLDVNVDPNQSTTSRVDLQLSAAQLQTAIGIGQRIYPNLSIWSQYYTGGPGVSLGDPDQHKLSSSEGNEVFTRLYRGSGNLNFIIKNSKDDNYIAVAKIMQAYNFQVCADLFGDIPFTDALKGDIADGSILHPGYNSAKDVVYPGIIAMVEDAIAKIENAPASAVHPGTDDLIFGGNMVKWNKFAHTLLLKMYLRSGNTAKATALAASGAEFITANEDNAAVAFPGGSSGSNPFWNAAKSTALGNYYVATTTVLDFLTATHDPRIDKFFDRTPENTHVGLYPGDIQAQPANKTFSRPAGALSSTGGRIFSPTAPVILLSSWEGNLLLAEAASLANDAAASQDAYEAGVKASFEYLGVDAPEDSVYIADSGIWNGTDANTRAKSIALQKWTCMNGLQPVEAWIETRRFDSAGNPIFASAGGLFKSPTHNSLGAGIFPSILPYPENEESLNQSFVGQHPITAKVFWDN